MFIYFVGSCPSKLAHRRARLDPSKTETGHPEITLANGEEQIPHSAYRLEQQKLQMLALQNGITRDPFSFKNHPASTYMLLKLKGIVLESGTPIALINDKTVKTGEKINNCTVKEIKENNVVIEFKGDTHILRIGESLILKN